MSAPAMEKPYALGKLTHIDYIRKGELAQVNLKYKVMFEGASIVFPSKRKALNFLETLLDADAPEQFASVSKYYYEPEEELFDRETGELFPGTAEALEGLR